MRRSKISLDSHSPISLALRTYLTLVFFNLAFKIFRAYINLTIVRLQDRVWSLKRSSSRRQWVSFAFSGDRRGAALTKYHLGKRIFCSSFLEGHRRSIAYTSYFRFFYITVSYDYAPGRQSAVIFLRNARITLKVGRTDSSLFQHEHMTLYTSSGHIIGLGKRTWRS